MKKNRIWLILILTLIFIIGGNCYAADAETDQIANGDYGVEVVSGYWDKNSGFLGDYIYGPYVKIKVTNNKSTPVSSIKVKVVFYQDDNTVLDDESSYIISSGDTPLKPGYNTTAFIRSGVGYKSQLSEILLPDITAEIYVNDVVYGTVDIEKTYESNQLNIVLAEERPVEEAEKLTEIPEGEIGFFGLPFGSNLRDVEAAFSDYVESYHYFSSYYLKSYEWMIDSGELTFEQDEFEQGYKWQPDFEEDLYVGGYKVSDLEIYFIYGSKDGIVSTEKDDAVLYKGVYKFNPVDKERAFQILTEKLSSVYGEPVTETQGSGNWWNSGYGRLELTTDIREWKGENDTGVLLSYQYGVTESDGLLIQEELYIQYGKTNSLELFDDVVFQINNPGMTRDDIEEPVYEGTDGL